MMSKILIFILLIVGLIVGVILVGRQTGFFSKADLSSIPYDIKISNISDNSFTISWLTAKAVPGFVSYGEDNKLKEMASDDRDSSGPKNRTTHHVTLKNLSPATTYYYKINTGSILTQTTAPTIADTPPLPDPIFGKVSPASETIIYLKVGDSSLLSSYAREDGKFLITLNNARSKDLKSYISIKDSDVIDLMSVSADSSKRQQFPASARKAAITLTLEKNPLKGDLNGDGVVNAIDYAISLKRMILK